MKRFLLPVLFAVLTIGVLKADEEEPLIRTLQVTGIADVSVAPDICYMSFVVQTTHRKAADAYQENVEIMNRINTTVKAHGIASRDMKTTNFSIIPLYHYSDIGNRRIFDGYQVNNVLHIGVRDLGKVSAVLDAAVDAGAVDIQGINFTVENPRERSEEARLEALKAAKAKADEAAAILGFKLGTPISVSETEPGTYNPYNQQNLLRAGGAFVADCSAAPALEAGEVKLTRIVYVTWEIEPVSGR